MNSIEWLLSELEKVNYHPTEAMVMYAKKLHKKEHGDTWDAALLQGSKRAGNFMRAYEDFDDYYKETFVSKGSDEAELPKHPSVISENGNELLFDKEGNLIKEVVEDDVDVEKFALKYIDDEWSDADDTVRFGIEVGVKIGYNKAKETLYTEEQVREAISKSVSILVGQEINLAQLKELTIQSLKQPKKQ